MVTSECAPRALHLRLLTLENVCATVPREMDNCHVTVTFPAITGLARDNVVNSFTFSQAGGILPGDMDDIFTALNQFYEAVDALVLNPVISYIGPAVSRSAPVVVRFYDIDGHLNGSPAGSPVRINASDWSPGASASATGLPSEVAVCLTAYADFGSDVEFGPGTRPRARDRGRVYIGPLNTTAQTTAIGRTRPDPALLTNLAEAGARLARAPMGPDWVVWSRRAAAVKNVTSVSVDDAFDTQRRRGIAPTAKVTRAA